MAKRKKPLTALIKNPLTALMLCVLTACTWVKLEPEAQQVQLLTAEEAEHCKTLRRTTSQVVDKIGFIKRGEKKLQRELATLARNTAVQFGGNAVVADSDLANGKLTFIILDCPE